MLQTRYFFQGEFTPYLDIFKTYAHRFVAFPKNDYLLAPANVMHHNYFITKGFCKVSVLHDSGEEKIIGYWGTNSIYPIITSEQQFLLEDSIIVTAMTDMETMEFTPETTRLIMKEHPEVSYEMIDHYCKFTNLLFFCTTTQTFEDLKMRICNMLYIYYVNEGSTRFRLTQSELASLVGAKRESIVKILKELRTQEIITVKNNHIELLSIEKLKDYGSFLL